MLTITSNEQARELIKNGVLAVEDDIEIAFDGFFIEADINCHNIYSKDKRRDIICWDINCWDINCGNINCCNINCKDINCRNIDCGNIDCKDINYYAVCFAYKNITCKSIKGERENARHFCLDGEITIKEDEVEELTMEEVCRELGRNVKIKK